nr:uncharacterized protein LOC124813674 [Hydra vulgaris]
MKAGISTEDDLPQDNSEITGSKKKNLARHFLCDLSDVNAKIPLICGMEQQNEEHEEDDGSLLDYPVFELKSVQKRPIKMSSNIIKPSVKAKDLSVVDFTSITHIASKKVYSITQGGCIYILIILTFATMNYS